MADPTINPDVAQVEPTVLSSFLIETLIEYHREFNNSGIIVYLITCKLS